ncbi:cytochrome o ubiquinol oxidase subunit 2 [Rhodoblastus acidophilus]|uniref:ubiquinol oxidase subunit II n=1 Tax=Rhodoblastus acidophilus TaxID=1074 RepID=UPI0022256E57|nr:ubiquinol oxidase subunit II [Rhodoblastus acidophilus]MCW2283908.1 cytochrome o ubiquinol oxidase subunit 2 [Rhodoblastus acidophilus]MCW2332604.1 cytochrome o ubiquinol oxidase subunit 2 [Rhodoblastus acidophilus]
MSLAAAGGLSGCTGVLAPTGPVGADIATILIDATLIMLAVIVPTLLLAGWTAWRYRASNTRAPYLPYWSYSGRIEAVVWAIPILVIIFLGGVIWIGSYKLDPFRPLDSKTPALEVQAVALDWKWLFIYPQQGVATVNQLVVPAGTPIHFSITSASVFNVFFIPRLGSMIYAMPGMVAQLHLQADHPTELWGVSAQFSGDGFSDMKFNVSSLPRDQFDRWVQQVSGPTLDEAAFKNLRRQSRMGTAAYGSVDPKLFDAIAKQKLGPAPGPELENSGREASAGWSL